SRKHTRWPIRITPTRYSSPTTTPEPPPPSIPADRTPATAAPPGLASTQAHSQVDTGQTLATRLLSTTNLPALSLQFLSPQAAADKASAPGNPLTVGLPGPLALAFTPAALTTASLAMPTTVHRLRFSDTCTCRTTTSMLGEEPFLCASPPTTVLPGPRTS